MRKRNLFSVLRLFSVAAFVLLFVFSSIKPIHAGLNKASYYDFGPYYGEQKQVLGVTLSSLEELPSPNIPQSALPPASSGILPGNPLHPFETIIENTQLALTFDSVKKEELRLNIATERLSEITTLIEQKKYDLAHDTASSYQNTMDTVANNLETLVKNNTPGVDSLVTKVENASASHALSATSFAFSSPPAATSTWNTIADASRDAMDTVADASNKPPIPEDLALGIQELKDQGFITPEQSDKLQSFDKRQEVREEIDKLMASGQFPIAEAAKLDEAVAVNYPDSYKDTVDVLQFAELRTYQTLPQPSLDISKKIEEWQGQNTKDVPPPPEIRPYLYTQRAEELAKKIDFSNFTQEHQTEVAKFYPKAAEENATFQVSLTPTPAPVATTVSITPTAGPTSTPLPTPTPPTAEPYLTAETGALPGDATYFLKQLGEGISLVTAFDPARRIELSTRYAEERFREANALSKDKDRQKEYEDALTRYHKELDSVSKDIKNFKGSSEDKKDLADKLRIESALHNTVLEKGLLPMPPENSELYTKVIETTENAMDRSADALGYSALPSSFANRLQDLKAQGLILPKEVDEITKATSREEVRENTRKLVTLGAFPPADAKKLDEGQALVSARDYNQLVEVRKIEELQRLRAVQKEFAQTATLRQTNANYSQRLEYLQNTIDTSMIRPEDLAGREELLKTYESIAGSSSKRPINAGQFGNDIIPGVSPSITPPARKDAVLGTCPIGAIFKQYEGCVWEHNGKKINDYDQYRCESPREYWSFAAQKCAAYKQGEGRQDDVSPICPVGYTWNWQVQSCQTGTSPLPFPSLTPEPTPSSDKEIEERSKSCPTGSSYNPPKGCVWDESGESVYNSKQYTCRTKGTYYSFEEFKCVPNPKEGEPFPKDASPDCKESNTFWSWSDGRCIAMPEPLPPATTDVANLSPQDPNFVAPDSPFYFLKKAFETVQSATALSDKAKQEVRLAQAKERFYESYYLLEKKNEEGFKQSLADYTSKMQEIYNEMPKIEKLNDSSKTALGGKLADQVVEQNLLLQKAAVLGSSDISTPISAAVSMTIQGIDRASDLKGEPPIPADVKTKIEALPKDMISEEDKKKILDVGNRVEARIKLAGLVGVGALTQTDTAFFDKELRESDSNALTKIEELKKLDEIASIKDQKEKSEKKVEKAEEIVKKLGEFEKTFEPGQDVPDEIRPYMRLTRIDEVANTIRPDIVNLDDFGNRKDVQLAVATLKEEFKPTKEAIKKLEDFRRNNPGRLLPFELARIEALAVGLGVRAQAESCFLPTPPFPFNTPCPPPGSAIPVATYYTPSSVSPFAGFTSYNQGDKDGKQLVYGEGPKPASAGICQEGYHWMYDNGGWCMSNSGNYSSSYTGSYVPTGTGAGYTPYSSYYTSPGAPSANYGYSIGGTNPYSYSPSSYYGVAPTYYTTNPPSGTVPGSGPKPTAPGQCPSGFHWMSDSGGWCMADGNTYVPGGSYPYTSYTSAYPSGTSTSNTPPQGGYNCGSQSYDPVTKRCKDGACPGGFNWDGSKCVSGGTYYSPNLNQSSCGPGYYWDGRGCIPTYSGTSSNYNYSPSSYQYGCTPGYYWDGSKCAAGSNEGSGWSDTSARSQSWCQPPSSGCGSNSYWDYGSCYCRSSSTYYGGSGPSPSNQCQGLSCGGGAWLDYSTCSCKYSGGSGTSSTGSTITCYPPSQGCPGGWYDYGTCSCKTSSSTTYTNTGCANVSASSCGSGWYFDSSACTCRQSSTSGSSGSTTTSSGTSSSGSSSGSCPSGYHWMSDNGGWCMSDSSSGSSTSQPSTSTTTSSPTPSDSGSTSTTTSSPPPTESSSPPPSTTTESSSPPPSDSGSSSPPPSP